MKIPPYRRPPFYMLLFAGIIVLIVLIMQPVSLIRFGDLIDVIFPTGLIARKELDLLLIIQGLMLFVIIPVYALTFIFSWRYSAQNPKGTYDPDLVDNNLAELIWWGFPLVMTVIVCALTWIKTEELDPYKPLKSDKKALTIQAVALQWKWLFIYPKEQIASVNYLEIPLDRPIHFDITADAPMNSLWIPDLAGQIYAMPGMKTELNLISNKEGDSRGSSANISGEGFAAMNFIAHTSSEENFEKWVESVKHSSNSLNFKEYSKLAAPGTLPAPQVFKVNDPTLFTQIIDKYMKPTNNHE